MCDLPLLQCCYCITRKLGLWVHNLSLGKALTCILHMHYYRSFKHNPPYRCWLFWCHYKSMTKSTAMTSELIMAKQFNMWSLIPFETLALSSSRSLYLQWWVTQQQVLGEPWRVLSFCHLYDKLPRQWTWRARTLIQFQLLTLGIRLHAFAGLGKGDSPPQKERKKKKR